jgi:hypothetical protein
VALNMSTGPSFSCREWPPDAPDSLLRHAAPVSHPLVSTPSTGRRPVAGSAKPEYPVPVRPPKLGRFVDGRDHKGVGNSLFARPLQWRLGVQVVAVDPSAAFRKSCGCGFRALRSLWVSST